MRRPRRSRAPIGYSAAARLGISSASLLRGFPAALNAVRLALRRHRIILEGDLTGAWYRYGGHGAPLRHLARRREACAENNVGVTARLADEEIDAFAQMARSRAALPDIFRSPSEPDRDRKPGVVE